MVISRTSHVTSLPKVLQTTHSHCICPSVCLPLGGLAQARHGHLSVRPPTGRRPLNYDNPSPSPSPSRGPVEPPDGSNPDAPTTDDTWLVSRVCDATKHKRKNWAISPPSPRLPDLFVSPTRYHPRAEAEKKLEPPQEEGHQAEGQKSSRPSPGKEERKEKIQKDAETTGAGLAQGNTRVINNPQTQPPPLEVSPPRTKSSNHPMPSP